MERGRLWGRTFLCGYALTFHQLTAWSRGLLSHTARRPWLGAGRLRPALVEGFARGETPQLCELILWSPCRNLQLRPRACLAGGAHSRPRVVSPARGLLLTWFLLFGHSPANFLPGAQPKLDLGAPEDTPSEGRAPWPCVVGRLRGAFDWGPTLDRVEIFFPDTGPAPEFHQLQPRQGSTTSSPPG